MEEQISHPTESQSPEQGCEIIYTSTHFKERNVRTWSPLEDQRLLELYETFPKNWTLISSHMKNRNINQCLHRYRRLVKVQCKNTWTSAEDELVKELVSTEGKNWKMISKMLNTKTGKQIRERYINKLSPEVKVEPWSREQDEAVIRLFMKHGAKWSTISKLLPGRPENKIKNRFYSFISKNYRFQSNLKIKQNQDNIIKPMLLEKNSSFQREGLTLLENNAFYEDEEEIQLDKNKEREVDFLNSF